MKETLAELADAVRRRLPRQLQASFFGRPRGLVSIEECGAALDGPVECLRTDDTSRGVEPATMEDTLHWKFQTPYYRRRHHSDVWVARLEKGFIRAGRYALNPDFQLIEDVISEHAVQRDLAGGFATRRPFLHRTTFRHVALLGTHWCDSHFHWLLDVLPRVGILAESSVSADEVDRYAIPDTTIPPHVDALRHLGIRDEECLWMGPRDRIAVADLILPSLPERRGSPPAWAVTFLRDRFLPRAVPPEECPERVYVERRGTRRVTNQDAVDEVLTRHNIKKVHPEEHSFREQVALFKNAELVVGPHGAGLANIVFAAPETRVVEIFSPNYVNVCNSTIASRLGLQYSYLIGTGERPPAGVDPGHVFEDITVDVGQIDRWLQLHYG